MRAGTRTGLVDGGSYEDEQRGRHSTSPGWRGMRSAKESRLTQPQDRDRGVLGEFGHQYDHEGTSLGR